MVGPLARQLDPRNDLVGHVREGEAVGLHQQQLLLQAHLKGRALPEAMLRAHGLSPSAARAAMRPNTSAAASPLA